MQVEEVIRVDLPPVELGLGSDLDNSFLSKTSSQPKCFVAGPENRLSILALEHLLTGESEQALSVGPSPLMLVGPLGSGKSLLVRGILRRWHSLLGEDMVGCFSAIDFARELQIARSESNLVEFRSRLRNLRLLAIEDLHKLSASQIVQRELRDLIDAYCENNSTLICTSRIPPTDQQLLDHGLRDRLLSSLILWLNYPGVAARLDLLKLIALEQNISIEPHRLCILAEAASGTASQVIRSLKEWEVAPTLGQNPAECRDALPPKLVLTVVARYFGLTQAALKGPARRKSLVFARSFAVYLLRTLTHASYGQIGRILGNRDHSTVMHAMNSIQESLLKDFQTRKTMEDLRRILLAV